MGRNAAGMQGIPLTSISALSQKNQTPCFAACLSAATAPPWAQSRSTSRFSARIFSRSAFANETDGEDFAEAEQISIMGISRMGFAGSETAGTTVLSLKIL